mgnify:FL=1|jgi:hypothetical protein
MSPSGDAQRQIEKDAGLYVPQDKHLCFAAPYESTGVVSKRSSSWKEWVSLGPLRPQQIFYLFVMHTFGAGILSGAANFGVACAMYRTTNKPIKMWPLNENTLAGDMGVTVVIQQIITYIVTSNLCNFDLRHGTRSLTRPWPPMMHFPSTSMPTGSWFGVKMPSVVQAEGHLLYMGNAENKSRFTQFCLWFLRATCTGSERNIIFERGLTVRHRFERLLWTALQGGWWAVITFWWYWPIAIAITQPLYGDDDLRGTWTPTFIKLLFGGIMGLITNPIMAMMTLGAECHVHRFYPDLELWQETEPALPMTSGNSFDDQTQSFDEVFTDFDATK